MSNPQAFGYVNDEGTFRGFLIHYGLDDIDGVQFDPNTITDLGEGDDPFQVIDELVGNRVEFAELETPRAFDEPGTPFIIQDFRAKVNSLPHPAKASLESSASAQSFREALKSFPVVTGFWVLSEIEEGLEERLTSEYKELREKADAGDEEAREELEYIADEMMRDPEDMDEETYLEYNLAGAGADAGIVSDGYSLDFLHTSGS